MRLIALSLLLAITVPGTGAPAPAEDSSSSPTEVSGPSKVTILGLSSTDESAARKLIAEQINWIEKEGATRPRADDAAFLLERGLRRLGFPNATVRWELQGSPSAIVLTASHGKTRRLGAITFTGLDDGDSPKRLVDFMERATLKRETGLLRQALPYVESDIEAGLDEVAADFRSQGYLDASAGPVIETETDRSDNQLGIDIVVPITKGPLYHIGAITFSGNAEAESAALAALLAPQAGLVANADNLSLAYANAGDYLASQGYSEATIAMDATRREPPEPLLDLDLMILKGRQYRVAAIRVEGNKKTSTRFLEKRFDPLVGRLYEPQKADRIQRELLSNGLFRRISLQPDTTTDAEAVDLIVSVEEAKTRELGFSVGYGTYDGAILGFSARQNNLFGSGRLAAFDVEYTQRGISGRLRYEDSWFLESPIKFDAGLTALTRENDGYEKEELGLLLRWRRDFLEHHSISFLLGGSKVNVDSLGIPEEYLGDTSYLANSVGFAYSFDLRDNPNTPTKGFLAEGAFEYGTSVLGSDIGFIRGTGRLSYYRPLFGELSLALGARTGFIVTSGDTDEIPIDMRFFSGGSTSVRSFRERHLGPKAPSGDPIGGSYVNTFNIELTHPIAWGLKAAAFGDAGNLLTEEQGYRLDDFDFALGLGLRYDLPTGPIRLDYGWNPAQDEGDPSGAFHFSIGIAF
jgi:outer membrane protein insertion porin family